MTGHTAKAVKRRGICEERPAWPCLKRGPGAGVEGDQFLGRTGDPTIHCEE